jgi:tRNA (guanine-N7-)-methyltransferase
MSRSDRVIPATDRGFFGRRKGRPLRKHQAELFDTLLPRIAIDLSVPPPPDLRTLFPMPVREVRLEIGFGGAEHLLHEAATQPEIGFIGSEAFVNGAAKALAGIRAGALRNVLLHFGDATELIAWLPEAAVARVDLLYPDPWPKKRHWKRRFVQVESVVALARILTPGGVFRFASDIPDYVDWTLQRLMRSPRFAWTAERADDWRKPWPRYPGTRYEAKALREGRTPCYLAFKRC